MIVWLEMLSCLVVIGYAGSHLSRYGDILAKKTGLSAVTVANTPDIAVGDVLGSTVFNLAILIVLDALYRRETIYSRAAQGHILSAALGILLIAFTGFSLLLDRAGSTPALGHVGLYTPFIILVYIVAMRAIYQYEQRTLAEYTEATAERYSDISTTGNSRLRDCGSRDRGHRLMATFCCQGYNRPDGLGPELRRHTIGGRRDLRTGGRGDAVGPAHGRYRHGHR